MNFRQEDTTVRYWTARILRSVTYNLPTPEQIRNYNIEKMTKRVIYKNNKLIFLDPIKLI